MLINEPEEGQDNKQIFSQHPRGPGGAKNKPKYGIRYMPEYLKEYYKENGERILIEQPPLILQSPEQTIRDSSALEYTKIQKLIKNHSYQSNRKALELKKRDEQRRPRIDRYNSLA